MSLDIAESPLSALVKIEMSLKESDSNDRLLRAVNFMYYELAANTEGKPCEEIFAHLNEYFFETKKFQVTPKPLLLGEVLEKRCGCGSAVALLYMHIGHLLGLKFELVHWPLHAILKWDCQGKSRYIDLEQGGRILSEEELLQMVNQHKDQLQSLSLRDAIIQYLTYLSFYFRQNGELKELHETLCLILSLEPENTRFLVERALLRRELGLVKDALQDLKRYFSFNEKESVHSELLHIYEELKSF